jgi:hypothetical protein
MAHSRTFDDDMVAPFPLLDPPDEDPKDEDPPDEDPIASPIPSSEAPQPSPEPHPSPEHPTPSLPHPIASVVFSTSIVSFPSLRDSMPYKWFSVDDYT